MLIVRQLMFAMLKVRSPCACRRLCLPINGDAAFGSQVDRRAYVKLSSQGIDVPYLTYACIKLHVVKMWG